MAESTRWEYIIQTFGTTWHALKDDQLQAALNSLGEQGWEVFSVEKSEGSNKVRLAAKRPLSKPVRHRSAWPG